VLTDKNIGFSRGGALKKKLLRGNHPNKNFLTTCYKPGLFMMKMEQFAREKHSPPGPLSPAKRRGKEGEKNKNDLHHFFSNLHKRRL